MPYQTAMLHRVLVGGECEDMLRDAINSFRGDILLLNGNWFVWMTRLTNIIAGDPVRRLTAWIEGNETYSNNVLVCAQAPVNGKVKRLVEIVAQRGRRTGLTLLLLAPDRSAPGPVVTANSVTVECVEAADEKI